jgi:hypothetical protein
MTIPAFKIAARGIPMLLQVFKNKVRSAFMLLRERMRGYSDFYSFPFDVSTPLNQYAEQVLEEGCCILEALNIPYYVCDGTILGIVREDRLIPHDNDIDVAVTCEVDLTQLIGAFVDKGYTVGRKVFYRGKIQQLIFYSSHQVIFDICFWRPAADGYSYHYVPEVPMGRRQPTIYFTGTESVRFRERGYPTHPQIRKWLREHYGDDWQVPKQVKGDWRLDVKDIVE